MYNKANYKHIVMIFKREQQNSRSVVDLFCGKESPMYHNQDFEDFLEVCGRLYDITNDHMRASDGCSLFFPKTALLQATEQIGLIVDLAPIMDEKPDAFLHSIYALCFYRSVDPLTYTAFADMCNSNKSVDVKSWAIANARHSSEFYDRGGRFINGPHVRFLVLDEICSITRKYTKRLYRLLSNKLPFIIRARKALGSFFSAYRPTILAHWVWKKARRSYHQLAHRYPLIKRMKEKIRKSKYDWEKEEYGS